MRKPVVAIIRGAPACGKSTLSIALRDAAIAQGLTVSWLSWDYFHHLIEPRHCLTRNIILQDTRRLLKSAKDCIQAGSELIIIDGVFIYPEENEAIDTCFTELDERLLRYRLVASESELLIRNQSRAITDRLPDERIHEVANDPFWQPALAGETLLDSHWYRAEELAAQLLQDIDRLHAICTDSASPTSSRLWRQGTKLRAPYLKSFTHFDLLPVVENGCWQANTFFDFDLMPDEEFRLLQLLRQQPIIFRYLNFNSRAYAFLRDFSERYELKLEEQDRWAAPLLLVPAGQHVREFLTERSSRLKRSLKKSDGEWLMKCSTTSDATVLWQDAITIDKSSWKAVCGSDMLSLNREDLQYLPGILAGDDNYHLAVVYHLDGTPASWSLMIFDGCSEWYAAKWGCTERGRKIGLGIACLVAHLEILSTSSASPLYVDFWGRRSEIYNQLAVDWRERVNLRISL
ncbi:hypothetical protein DP187_21780 [Enterobacter cloacae]|nr:hypothetical protein DP187_21780 [Enterobacter cloacae]